MDEQKMSKKEGEEHTHTHLEKKEGRIAHNACERHQSQPAVYLYIFPFFFSARPAIVNWQGVLSSFFLSVIIVIFSVSFTYFSMNISHQVTVA